MPDSPALVRIVATHTSARVGALVFPEQAAEAAHLVRDPVLAQRVPEGRRVDGDDWLAQPALRLIGEAKHRQVGAHLYEGIDVGTVDLEEGPTQRGLVLVRDTRRG